MGKSAASKEQMMMREKKIMKSKDGFPAIPAKDDFANDLGYFTKVKKPGTRRRGK